MNNLTDNEKLIRRLAALTVATDQRSHRKTVLLGAGSSIAAGVPSWHKVCELIASKLHLKNTPQDNSIDLVKNYFAKNPSDSHERFLSLYPEISTFTPTSGHTHLAHLVRQGYISLILTTNWDPLVEIAMSKVLRPDQYRLLVRGETSDEQIAKSLRISPLPKIIKLHGDLSARLFHVTDSEMPKLSQELKRAIINLSSELFVVGSSLEDPDLINLITGDDIPAKIFYISPNSPKEGTAAHSVLRSNRHDIISGKEGTFDGFFTSLNLSVQRELISSGKWNGASLQKEIILALERGASTVSYNTVNQYVKDFARKIKARKPDLIAFIDDKLAPGGTEIARRLLDSNISLPPHIRVSIESDIMNRVVNRKAVVDESSGSDEAIRILLIDSVSFSGNTLKLASEIVSSRFPNADVELAALVVSSQLLERSRSGTEHWLKSLTYQLETDRHDIMFPWGSTFSTATINRTIGYVNPPRCVQIFRKPWGSGEIFVDEEYCSVRVLTVDAGQKLSFQRHLCRDELFVALDDETGFDISGHPFDDKPINEFDSRIESVSLEKGDYLLVPKGVWHRARALRNRARLLEIGLGSYDEINDIDRMFDDYGRCQ
jgi:mannose-6-phosphate isomerase-like protein (cupin superfamily)/hypoxanthine phosphoribosyltransferase